MSSVLTRPVNVRREGRRSHLPPVTILPHTHGHYAHAHMVREVLKLAELPAYR
jgi:hypothetical protein